MPSMPSRPSHFEIPVDDPDRAEKFYGSVFGWSFQRYPGAPQYYGMATTGDAEPGINGALFQRDADSETTLTMSVDSIEDTLKAIEAAGGKVLLGKTAIPSMGWFATCRDTEGNQFGLYTNDPNAA
jgi:predicted enzyme related to lactoylglutathione lyase